MKNSARKPADLTTINVGKAGFVQRKSETRSKVAGWRLCAIISENDVKKDESDWKSCSKFDVSALPSTLSLSSDNKVTASSALLFPTL